MENDRWQSALRLYLIAALFLISLLTLAHISLSWSNDAYLDHAPGVMVAMASDLAHGVFYRPLLGPLGYGGSRYFPLHFVLQAVMMKLGGGPILSGYLIALGSFILLLAGVFVLLRTLGTPVWLAICGALMLLCSASIQYGIVAIRSDILPAALAVWGLAFCAGSSVNARRILLAAIFFTLAFSAKVTSLYALAAAFLFLLASGNRRLAWRLALLSAAGIAAVASAILIASHGRAWQVLSASASGGAGFSNILHAPIRFGILTTTVDIGGFAILVLGLAALLAWPGRFWRDLPPLFFVLALITVLVIFGSPGTDINHLVDLQAAAIVLFITWAHRAGGNAFRFGLAALATAALFAYFPAWNSYTRGEDQLNRRQEFAIAVHIIESDPRPVLSENPLVPILAGRSPFVLDPFMFRVLRSKVPHFEDRLWAMLDRKQFGTVILLVNPGTDFGKNWYDREHFGPGFAEQVLKNYQLVYQAREEYIFKPRQP